MKLGFLTLIALCSAEPAHALSWDLVQGDSACGISKQFEDDGRTSMMFIEKVEGGYALDISNGNWSSIIPKQKYPLVLSFDKHYFTVDASGYADEGGKGFRFAADEDLANAFARAESLVIFRDTEPVTTVLAASLMGSQAGVARIKPCVSYLRRERDDELAEIMALERKREVIPADPFFDPNAAVPSSNPGRWIKSSDYPAAAMLEKREGVAAFRVTVDASGLVSACEITGSSGHGDLDAVTCAAVQREARFNPARSGSSARHYSNRVTWKVPGKTN